MNKVKFQNALAHSCFHASILLKGVIRTICGTLNAVLVGVSIYGFISIANEGGYTAVCDFVGSVATLMIALCNIYCMGMKKRSGKK